MRVFLIVLDSAGIGEMPDAAAYGDEGSNTFRACFDTGKLYIPNMKSLGFYNIDGINYGEKEASPIGEYARLAEKSAGKDTTTGHWEIAGVVSELPMPTYPNGFPAEIISEIERATGRGVLCNKPYSGTQVIADYGMEHIKTGKLIVYTSADSVLQIAAHEDIVPVDVLYEYCKTVRKIMRGKHGVGRIIARPFEGEYPNFRRTSRRHDFSLKPPADTMLDRLKAAGKDVIAVGKINDIFAGSGVTELVRTVSNDDGMDKTEEYAKRAFDGLCFVNLVDFDMLYGHRNDTAGYTKALNRFDERLGRLLPLLGEGDTLMITADHGCDPSTPSTDHSREYTPLLIYGADAAPGRNDGTKDSFSYIAERVMKILGE